MPCFLGAVLGKKKPPKSIPLVVLVEFVFFLLSNTSISLSFIKKFWLFVRDGLGVLDDPGCTLFVERESSN